MGQEKWENTEKEKVRWNTTSTLQLYMGGILAGRRGKISWCLVLNKDHPNYEVDRFFLLPYIKKANTFSIAFSSDGCTPSSV